MDFKEEKGTSVLPFGVGLVIMASKGILDPWTAAVFHLCEPCPQRAVPAAGP